MFRWKTSLFRLLAITATGWVCIKLHLASAAVTCVSSFTYLEVEQGLSQIVLPAMYAFFVEDSLKSNNLKLPGIRKMSNGQITATWKVIVLSYMRSGSSLTGDIIQQHPDVFYVFEPLKTIGRQFEGLDRTRVIHYRDNTSIDVSQSEEKEPALYIQTMRSIFRCRFEELDNGTLQQNHMMQSATTKDAYLCAQQANTTESQWQRLVRCFQDVNARCRSAKIISAKTIRLSMRQAEALIASDPTVKVIHLIRDPRGVLASRLEINERFKLVPFTVQARQLCSQVVENINKSKQISGRFSKRILTVRYEDIAESPVAAAKQLYDFLGMQLTASIEQYILSITYAGVSDGCIMCTVRGNASATAQAWRNKLPFENARDIQERCIHLFNIMGYRFFQSRNEMRSLNISAMYTFYDPDLFKVFI